MVLVTHSESWRSSDPQLANENPMHQKRWRPFPISMLHRSRTTGSAPVLSRRFHPECVLRWPSWFGIRAASLIGEVNTKGCRENGNLSLTASSDLSTGTSAWFTWHCTINAIYAAECHLALLLLFPWEKDQAVWLSPASSFSFFLSWVFSESVFFTAHSFHLLVSPTVTACILIKYLSLTFIHYPNRC